MFCGSGELGRVAAALKRNVIMVDNAESALIIANQGMEDLAAATGLRGGYTFYGYFGFDRSDGRPMSEKAIEKMHQKKQPAGIRSYFTSSKTGTTASSSSSPSSSSTSQRRSDTTGVSTSSGARSSGSARHQAVNEENKADDNDNENDNDVDVDDENEANDGDGDDGDDGVGDDEAATPAAAVGEEKDDDEASTPAAAVGEDVGGTGTQK
jgi:hypothetical protein